MADEKKSGSFKKKPSPEKPSPETEFSNAPSDLDGLNMEDDEDGGEDPEL